MGVETAGEIGELLNGTAALFASRPANERARVTLVAGDGKLLPVLRAGLSTKAEAFLKKVGVDVMYDVRVTNVSVSAADADTLGWEKRANMPERTTVHFDNGETLVADVYIPATGVTPNTQYLPEAMLDESGSVKIDTRTLRVDGPDARVYCIGDCGTWKRGGLLVIQGSIPIMCKNIAYDLSISGASPSTPYEEDFSETQLVPVGRKMGVGAFKGVKLPTFMVSFLKGRDYFLSRRFDTTMGKGVAKA